MHLLNEESMINYWCFLVAKAYEAAFLEGQYRNETDTLRSVGSITLGITQGTGLIFPVNVIIFLLVSLSPLFRTASAHEHKQSQVGHCLFPCVLLIPIFQTHIPCACGSTSMKKSILGLL